MPFTVADGQTVKWYYDPADHYVADSANKVIATAVGSFQSEVGGGDWSPDNLQTCSRGRTPRASTFFRAKNLPQGNYEFKVTLNESWDVNYGAGGAPGGDNLPLVIPAGGGDALFTYDPVSHIIGAQVLPPTEPPPPRHRHRIAVIHYFRPAGDYDGWGLHLWGDAIDPSEGTSWDKPKRSPARMLRQICRHQAERPHEAGLLHHPQRRQQRHACRPQLQPNADCRRTGWFRATRETTPRPRTR